MAKLLKKLGQKGGSVEVKGHKTAEGALESFGKPRKTDGTSVGATAGMVLSENYQSFKVEASVILPTTLENKKEAMQEAFSFVERELSKRLKSARKVLSSL